MKEWWARLREWNAERQKIVDANLLEMARAIDQMRLEQYEQQKERKRASKLARQNGIKSPWFATPLVFVCLPERCRDSILGDMTESYPGLRKKFGSFGASLRVCGQLLSSIWPCARETISRNDTHELLRWVALAGAIMSAVSLIKLLIGLDWTGDLGFDPLDPSGFFGLF